MLNRRHFAVAGMLAMTGLAACSNTMMAPPSPAVSGMPADPMVGGAAMYPTKDIIDNAVNSADHTTLVAAVKAAGLVATLKSPGPFTVFAPTNEAFAALPPGTVPTLLKPENKAKLVSILTYHVVPGSYDTAALRKMIDQGNGRAVLRTVEGGTLTIVPQPGGLVVFDAHGGSASITIPDVYQSNGVIMVINKVLMPPA
jgi:uncharacterized surface protein with fasciclin (FAS1) repeats